MKQASHKGGPFYGKRNNQAIVLQVVVQVVQLPIWAVVAKRRV